MDKFRFIKAIAQESCDIWIEGMLDDSWYGSSASIFRSELDYAINQMGKKVVNVRINSNGGQVQIGYAIFGAIQNAIDQGVNVITYNEGFAFSMGAMIFLASDKRVAKPYAQFMTHRASAETDNGDMDVLISNINASFSELIQSRCGLDEQAASAMLPESGDYFFLATEAKEKGFATEIYEKRPILMTAEQVAKIAASYCPEQKEPPKPEPKTQNQSNSIQMENIRATLGLPADATDEQVNAKVAELKAATAQAQNEAATAKATAFVEACILSGKIKDADKAKAIEKATASFDAFKEAMDMVESPKANHTAELYAASAAAGAENGGQGPKGSFSEMLQSDPEALAGMKKDDPAKYNSLAAKSGIKVGEKSTEMDLKKTLGSFNPLKPKQ